MQQISFSDAEHSAKKKITKREKFLTEMNAIVPWQVLLKVIEPHYPVAGNGRAPYPLTVMLRIHLMQQWFNLSDPGAEEALYEIASMRSFAGISLGEIPDETTILNFRRRIEDNELTPVILDRVNAHLKRQGLLLQVGTMVDATIIHAPSSTKNEAQERDPEMSQTKKGNQWYFGMKAHIGADTDSGLVHTVFTTAANEADIEVADELLHGKEQAVHADAGYTGADKRYAKKGRKWLIAAKRSRIKNLPEGKAKEQAQQHEHDKASVRAKVEHAFHTLKCTFGYRKTRFKGLVKNTSQIVLLFALGNLYKVRAQLMALKQTKAQVRLRTA
jgi:transposase, IS5 family